MHISFWISSKFYNSAFYLFFSLQMNTRLIWSKIIKSLDIHIHIHIHNICFFTIFLITYSRSTNSHQHAICLRPQSFTSIILILVSTSLGVYVQTTYFLSATQFENNTNPQFSYPQHIRTHIIIPQFIVFHALTVFNLQNGSLVLWS